MTERAKYWQGLLLEWRESGLSQAAFCRRHGVKAVTFGWWKRKLGVASPEGSRRRRPAERREAAASEVGPGFVEIRPVGRVGVERRTLPIDRSNGDPIYEVLLSGGRAVRLPRDFDPEAVSRLISAVESAC